jgi:hypothetical protein
MGSTRRIALDYAKEYAWKKYREVLAVSEAWHLECIRFKRHTGKATGRAAVALKAAEQGVRYE